jgi:hypothetical protein
MNEPISENDNIQETKEEIAKRLNDTVDRALILVDKLIKEKNENIRNNIDK